MGVNSLPKTVTSQRRGCDLNPGPTTWAQHGNHSAAEPLCNTGGIMQMDEIIACYCDEPYKHCVVN